jgi:CRP-like cAMP-binding protein
MVVPASGDVLQTIVRFPRLAPYRFEVPADVTLFRQGSIADAALLLEKGRVELSIMVHGAQAILEILGEGEFLGEMALLDGGPRSATARTLETCVVKVIPADQFHAHIASLDSMTRAILIKLSQRVRAGNVSKVMFPGAFKG